MSCKQTDIGGWLFNQHFILITLSILNVQFIPPSQVLMGIQPYALKVPCGQFGITVPSFPSDGLPNTSSQFGGKCSVLVTDLAFQWESFVTINQWIAFLRQTLVKMKQHLEAFGEAFEKINQLGARDPPPIKLRNRPLKDLWEELLDS